jgi:hypothetical protein
MPYYRQAVVIPSTIITPVAPPVAPAVASAVAAPTVLAPTVVYYPYPYSPYHHHHHCWGLGCPFYNHPWW